VSPLRVEERQGRHHAASRAVRCEFHRDARPALRPALRGLSSLATLQGILDEICDGGGALAQWMGEPARSVWTGRAVG
jgi:hypothetical protein